MIKSPKLIKLELHIGRADRPYTYILNLETDKTIEELENEFTEDTWDGVSNLDYAPFVEWLKEKGYADEIKLETVRVGDI